MKEISPEDKTKLHNEINQLLNQRFILATTSITVFGVFTTFSLPKVTVNEFSPELILLYVSTVFLMLFLALLFYWACILENNINLINQYMIKCNASEWEKDIKEVIDKKTSQHNSFYLRPVFVFLGTATAAWPVVIEISLSTIKLNTLAHRHTLIFIAYLLYYITMKWLSSSVEKTTEIIEKEWDDALKEQNKIS